MRKIFAYISAFAAVASVVAACSKTTTEAVTEEPEYLCIAYAWEADGPLPEADQVTAINYLAGYPNATHDGVDIHNVPRLQKILELKQENPDLKVILSMGGAGAGLGWAEMTGNDSLRAAFVEDCKNKVAEFGLDGVDFDWEFPQNDEEVDNYIKLFRDAREALDSTKVVSAAVGFWGNGFDMKRAIEHLDYLNLMSYDMGWQAPYHHTSLRRSPLSGVCTLEESLDTCISQGIEPKDIVVGLAFYGRGDGKNFKDWTDYRDIKPGEGMEERWDSIACVPYIVDSLGTLVVGYENPRSLKIKCDYIKERGFKGGMYWRTELDADNRELTRTVAHELLGR